MADSTTPPPAPISPASYRTALVPSTVQRRVVGRRSLDGITYLPPVFDPADHFLDLKSECTETSRRFVGSVAPGPPAVRHDELVLGQRGLCVAPNRAVRQTDRARNVAARIVLGRPGVHDNEAVHAPLEIGVDVRWISLDR